MVGEGVEVLELPKLPLLINPVEGNPLVRPDAEDPPFNASISLVNSCLGSQDQFYIKIAVVVAVVDSLLIDLFSFFSHFFVLFLFLIIIIIIIIINAYKMLSTLYII